MFPTILIYFAFPHFLPILALDITLPDSLDSCKGFTIYSSATTTKLGYSVDGGGDINNDTIPDIIVSDYLYSSTSTSATSNVYVIYGTKTGYSDIDIATMNSSQGFKISGLSIRCDDNANFLSSTGDVDGDGIADIVIGATTSDSNQGAAYVIYGKQGEYEDFDISALTDDMGYKISGNGGQFGWNVNSKGDINGDGVTDIIVSGSVIDTTFGGAYIIYGQKARGPGISISSLASDRGFKLSGDTHYYSGAAISSAGDFNGDNIMDFSITAPGASSDIGSAFIVYGKNGTFDPLSLSTMTTDQGFTVQGVSPIHYLALVASEAGDFNNDGVSDILFGAYKSTSSTMKGLVYLIYGKKGSPDNFLTTAMEASQGFTISGLNNNDYLGSSLAGIGDVNGDGIDDIILGAKGFSSSKGAMYVIYGREDQPASIDLSNLTISQGFQIFGTAGSDLLGSSVRNLGDINQDGVPDMILGVPGANRAYVLFGPNSWGCDVCNTSSTCLTCQTGFNYTYNGLCFQECPVYAPFELNNECFVKDPRDSETTQTKGDSEELINSGLKGGVTMGAAATNAANKVTNIWSPADALPFIYGQLKISIMYMRYLNISRTEKLEELYQLYYDSDTSIIPWISMPSSVKDSFPTQNLPYMFKKYGLPSSFIANFGDDGMCLLIILAAFLTVQLVYLPTKRWLRGFGRFKLFLQRITVTLQNFLIGSFGESMGSITFYATLEFKNHCKNDKGYYLSSPLVCAFSLILGLLILIINIIILAKFHEVRRSNLHKKSHKAFTALEKKYKGIAVLFKEFHDSSFVKQSAFLLFSFRTIAEGLIVGLLYEYPITQSILLILINFALLVYLIVQRPFESIIDLIQQLVLLLLIFICGPCLVLMAHTDKTRTNYDVIIDKTSNILFFVLVIFQFIPLLFFGLSLLESAWKLYKWFSINRSITKKKKSSPIPKAPRPPSELDQSSLFVLDRTIINIDQTRVKVPGSFFSSQYSGNSFGMDEESAIFGSQAKIALHSVRIRAQKKCVEIEEINEKKFQQEKRIRSRRIKRPPPKGFSK